MKYYEEQRSSALPALHGGNTHQSRPISDSCESATTAGGGHKEQDSMAEKKEKKEIF